MKQHFMLLETDEYSADIEQEKIFVSHFNGNPNSSILLCELDGELVGFLGAAGGNSKKIWHSATIFLGVRKNQWGRGIASKLITETMRWARSAGLGCLELTVSSNNHWAINLYYGFGFELEGVKISAIKTNGNLEDELVMGCFLATR